MSDEAGYCPACEIDIMPIGNDHRCPNCGRRVPAEHRATDPDGRG